MRSGNESIAGLFKLLVSSLQPLYGPGESASIARIVFEDAFLLYDLKSEQAFPETHFYRFEEILTRLLRYEPVQYILGQADFFGLKFEVNPHVLIPRQETEELVLWILDSCAEAGLPGNRLLDVGSGSGCIPIVLKKKLPSMDIVSVDISPQALEVARRNSEKHHAAVDWRETDFLRPENWPSLGAYDLIVSNPPYIDPSEKERMSPNVLAFEPPLALFTSSDPMEFYQAIAGFARENLNAGGNIFVEFNEFRLEDAAEIFKKTGFKRAEGRTDINDNQRMLLIFN